MQGHPGSLLQTAVVAALLHDIGVLAQRAADASGPTTGHAPLAAAFVAERAPAPFRAASTAILAHHRPDDRLSRLVAAADRLAAGGPDDEESGRPLLQRRSPFPLLPLGLPENAPARPPTFFPVGPLPHDLEGLTPRPAPMERDEVRRRLLALAEMVATEHTVASSPDFAAYLSGLLDLIWRTCILVPAPAREPANDISLAAHLHVTAALAACLAADEAADERLEALASGSSAALDAPVALALGVRLRRCLSHPNAGLTFRALQARSLLEAVLTDVLADWLIESFHASPVARLTVDPGRLLLLLPLSAQERLPAVARELDRRLLDGGAAFIASIAATPITGREVGGAIGVAMERLEGLLQQAAARPYGALGAVELNRLFSARDPDEDEEAASLAHLGDQLENAAFLLIEALPDPDGVPASPAQRALAAFGRRLTLLAEPPSEDLAEHVRWARLERLGVVGPHDPAVRAWAVRQRAPIAIVSRPPLRPSNGTADVALLEIDLDFSRQLRTTGHAAAPLARLVDGGRLLRYFLDAVGVEAAGRYAASSVTIVHWSADGITCLGRPDELPRIGFALAQGLSALTGDHPAIRLSAAVGDGLGSADTQHRAVAAALARGAKRRQRGGGPARVGRDKNALTFFGATLGWDEFRPVWERFNRLTDLIVKRGVSPRLLRVVRAGEGAPGRGRWTWRATAALRQFADQGQLPEVDFVNLTNDVARPESAARLALAARWAEEALRRTQAEARHD
ncbi:MAG: HD domain-containing protein [Chloroflexota bacterium]|nr:HD domain-containing protein [Dehalococcoidia bacterium]MDW8254184.1 HD domain-containing protein [Chloroflexota bacterium]